MAERKWLVKFFDGSELKQREVTARYLHSVLSTLGDDDGVEDDEVISIIRMPQHIGG